jgi:hypothetical protein
MKVSLELIEAEASKAYLPKDSNYAFLQEYNKGNLGSATILLRKRR